LLAAFFRKIGAIIAHGQGESRMAKTTNGQSSAKPLPAHDAARLRAAVRVADDPKHVLGLPAVTVARALAGYPIREGTAALIRERLAAAEAAA
jgi:hypothetical protein